MPKPQRELAKINKPKLELRHYQDYELKNFHDKIQKYYYDYFLEISEDKGEVIRVLDKKKLMIDFGALGKDGGVIIDEVEVDKPPRIHQFDNLYEQWQNWKIRTGLDKGSWGYKNLESLDKLAEQMTVEPAREEFNIEPPESFDF